jgi:hypothetical protein
MQFAVDAARRATYLYGMNSAINFIELENRIISANYRNLMIKAKVVLVDKASGEQLPDPVTTIASPAPNGSLRIRLPDSVKSGAYYLKALNGHGEAAAKSAEFYVN